MADLRERTKEWLETSMLQAFVPWKASDEGAYVCTLCGGLIHAVRRDEHVNFHRELVQE